MGKKKKRKSKKPFSLFFWIAVILAIGILVLLRYKPINENLTDLTNKNNTETIKQDNKKKPETSKDNKSKPNVVETITQTEKKDEINISILPSEKKQTTSSKEQVTSPKVSQEKNYTANIYYLSVSDDMEISLQKTPREVKYISTPLANTIETMISGISSEEVAKGMMNFIPSDTKLLSATIKQRVAYLDFSKEFLVDQFGREGANAKLMQIVYTATEFPTIDKVQFLVEGEIRNYLNAEGINIGKPLSRQDFK